MNNFESYLQYEPVHLIHKVNYYYQLKSTNKKVFYFFIFKIVFWKMDENLTDLEQRV